MTVGSAQWGLLGAPGATGCPGKGGISDHSPQKSRPAPISRIALGEPRPMCVPQQPPRSAPQGPLPAQTAVGRLPQVPPNPGGARKLGAVPLGQRRGGWGAWRANVSSRAGSKPRALLNRSGTKQDQVRTGSLPRTEKAKRRKRQSCWERDRA